MKQRFLDLGLLFHDCDCKLRKHLIMLFILSTCMYIEMNAFPLKMNESQQQQQRKITGTVISKEDNQPIVGATILIEGTAIGVITDIDGKFTISNVPAEAKNIKISFVGMESQILPIKPIMTVILNADSQTLDEVLVVAYGSTKKSSFTGSASLINAEKIDAKPVTSITNALVGATSGVQVTTANGQPGSSPSIYIRGIGSYGASNTPLIILDGMPYDNSISSINPNDIESLTVLKDASSSALYGSRAANGVIMITTKKGQKEKMRVNLKYNQGITAKQSGDYKKVGVNNYVKLYWENLRNQYIRDGKDWNDASQEAAVNLFDNLTYNPFNLPSDQVVNSNGEVNPQAKLLWEDDTDWEDAIQQLGSRTDASVSISGGTEKSDYFTSIGYTDEHGYIIGSRFKRYTARANINSQILRWLKIGTNIAANMSMSDGNQNESQGNNINPFRFVRYVAPIYPIHVHNPQTGEYMRDANGNLIYDFGTGYSIDGTEIPLRDYISGNNPALELQKNYNSYKRNTINAKAYMEIAFLKDFKFTFNGGVGSNSYLSSSASIVYPEKGNTGSATKSNSFTTTWTFNELLTYTKDFKKHHVDVLVGHESYEYEYNYLTASMKDQKFDGNYELANYTNLNTTPNSYTNEYTTEGYLSRINYDYDNQYFLSASFRRDGSSRFYKDSRWGNFWSIGGGWRIDKEEFMKNLSFINLLKLRASYGEVGNDDIGGYYPWRATYSNAQNAEEAGYIQSSLGNKNLKWEVSHSFDVALEFALFDNIRGSIEYFDRRSSNLLFSVPLSLSSGVESQDMNAGCMYNKGVEIEISADILNRQDFTWKVSANASHIKNRVTDLPVDPFISGRHKVEEGHSRYEFYLKQWIGVDPQTGSSLYLPNETALESSESLVDVDGITYTTDIDEALEDYCGDAMPKLTGGFSTNLMYKGFNLDLNFFYQLGGKMYDTAYSTLMSPGTGSLSYSNLHVDMLKRWQKPGDITDVPRISNGSDSNDLTGVSSRWLISSDMLELATINFGYTFPDNWISRFGLSALKLYFSAENVFQITKRQGIYPRKNISGYSSNGDVYLPSRVFTMGLNLTF
ncbi:MAG: TonB-dependent receptor [Mediterranea sp.]|nr:TonB-dependent receptor [Mediterranea sp.]